ncbi:threonine/serine exporter family protein [Corynebacterium diphtheriae bv. mitis]|nr:threonine/serine exporter family protein [Corynebacterium diphtheriae]MBG9338622.1 threonine/serine exporter family protein [Corynebacterium diphtheriae bv. mitis]
MTNEDQFRMGVEADAVVRLGMLLMGAGTSGYRVIRGMKRAARALGFDRVDAVIGVTQITSTIHKGSEFRTVVAKSQTPAVDASRIEALENLTHQMHRRITAEQLNAELDTIEFIVVNRWSSIVLTLAAAFACASFAVLNHFDWLEAGIVAVSAGCGQYTRHRLHKMRMHQLGCVAAAGTVASLSYFAITRILLLLGFDSDYTMTAGYVAAVLFLIPGFPLFSAMIDLGRFDFEAGTARLMYALTVIATATFSVAMVSWGTGLNPEPVHGDPHPAWLLIAGVASFVGIAGFAFLFNSSRRMVLVAAVVGTAANLIRLLLEQYGATAYFAAFVGGVIIGLVGAVASKKVRLPRITTTVPAAIILIPGTAMFRAVYYLNSGDMDHALSNAATAAMVVFSISAGLVLARLLTDRAWTFGHLIEFDKPLA